MNLQFTRAGAPPPPPPMHIILASQSIGRKMLLEKAGIHFRVVISRIDEETIIEKDPLKMIRKRAVAKINEVIANPRVYTLAENAKTLVIAADSMCLVGKKAYGKPADREEAKVVLKNLMGKTHQFTTAVAIVLLEDLKEKKRWEKTVTTKVTLGKLNTAQLESYVTRYDLSRFAGAYTLNETPWDLVEKVDGSYTNVIGLPFEVLLPIFRELTIV